MTTFTTLSLNDSVPAARSFGQVRKNELGTAMYAERSGGIPVLYPEVHLSLFAPPPITNKLKGNAVDNYAYKAVVKVIVPVPDVTAPASGSGVQPAPSKAYDVKFTGTWDIPVRSNLLTRKDSLAFVKSLLAKPEVTNMVESLEGIY